MEKTAIVTTKAPAAIGPYSQAMLCGNLIFSSGQIPIDPATGQMVEADPAIQAKQSMENVKAILEAAGSTMNDVIKTTIFLKDLAHFAAVNEVYGSYFTGTLPARSCVQVAHLPKDALVEIEVIALKK